MMRLISLSLKNFKRHETLHANFTDGVNLIVGPNYTGKSSLLHGVLYALFGAKQVPCEADDLVRRGASRMEATLVFGTAERQYTLSRTKSGAELLMASLTGGNATKAEVLAKGHSAVTSKVEEILGMPAKRFAELRYAEQKQTEALLTYGTTQLHALLEELAGASTVNAAIAKTSSIRSEQQAVLDAMGDLAGVDVPALEARLLALREERAALPAPEALQAATADAADRRQDARAKARVAEQGNNARLAAEQAHEAAVAEAQAADEHLRAKVVALTAAKAHTDTSIDSAQYRQHAATLRAKRSQYDVGRRARDEWAARMRGLSDSLAAKTKAVASANDAGEAALKAVDAALGTTDADDRRQALQSRMNALGERQRALEAEMAALKARRTQIKQGLQDGVCVACKRPFDDADVGHRQALEKELAEVQAKGAAAADSLNAVIGEIGTVTQLSSTLVSAAGEAVRQAAELAALAQRHDDCAASEPADPGLPPDNAEEEAKQADELAARGDFARSVLATATAAHQQAEQARADKHTAVKAKLEAVLAAPAMVDLNELNLALAAAEAAYDSIAQHEQQVNARRAGIGMEITSINRDIEREQRVAAARQAATSRRDVASALWSYLRDNRDRFMGDIWASVMASASAFVTSCTDGDIERLYRDADGAFRYVEKGEDFSARGSASGAQRSLMGLGIKIAMCHLARSEFGVLLMDEPSSDMDPKVSAAMTALLSGLGLQVVMVSHREFDSSMASNIISTVEQ